MDKEHEMLDEKQILAGNTQGNLLSRLSITEREALSLDYETWMKHMKRDFPSMKVSEEEARLYYKKLVAKYSRRLNKIILAKAESSGSKLILVPAEHTFTENFKDKAKTGHNELHSKKNFDLIRKRTEIRQRQKLE